MGIRGWFIGLVFLYTTISLGAAQRDSIVIDTRWNRWHVESVSSNGNWTFVYQLFQNDTSKNKAFVIDTDSKKRIEVTGLHYFSFTANNFLLGKKEKETVELDLKTKKQSVLGTLKQQDWIEESQTLCYITDENELVLRRYEKKGAVKIISIPQVSKYYLSPSKTQLLYEKEGDYEVYVLDVSTGKERYLIQLNEELNNLIWNADETVVAVPLKDRRLQTIDLKEGENRIIEVPTRSGEGVLLNISFFPNNDLYFERFIEVKENNPEKEYLDIWNGNDRELKYKVLPKKEGEWSTFTYHQNTDTIVELPTSKKKRYWNIGIDNYLLVFEPLELQDYSTYIERVRYRLLDLVTMEELGDLTVASSLGNSLNKSPNNQYIIYPQGEDWEVYDFKTHGRLTVPHCDRYSKPIWSVDSKWVYYSNGQNLMKVNVESGQTESLTNLNGKNHFSFENEFQLGNSRYIDSQKPFLFSTQHANKNMSYYSLFQDKITIVVDNTLNRLNLQYLKRGISEDGNTVVWTEENYNLPPTVKVYRKGRVETLLEPEVSKELYTWQKQKVIYYKDKHGVDLTGVLWYPKGFEPTKKYPMITHVYERQGGSRSVFGYSTPLVEAGFNRTLLNEQGYFVFMPDTYVSDEGPGQSALECVTKGIQAIIVAEPSIDNTKLGLIGHSFGGYKTSFVLSQTDLFAAGVSGAGIHDLISYTYEYNYSLKMPNYFRVENSIHLLKDSFSVNSKKYYNNSPIHFAQDFTTPVLLWTGMQDYNVHWEQTRLLDWFDYYLKGKKGIEWISKGIEYHNY